MKGSNIIFFIFCCLFPASSTTCTDPTGCEFICVGDDPCKDATMTCADGADCVVVCTGYQACAGATINCGANANCNVYCNQTDTNNWSCYNTRIFAESSNQLTVLAIGNNVAKEADISCPNNAPCDLTFIGDNSGYESTINCGNGGQCTITAEGKESLYAGVGTAINAENSETVVITASGQRALGLILKCPRFQSSSEPQCVIKMISDTGTNYDGNEILRWNYISIDSASDIEFECDGTQYDAFFHSTNNEIRSYTDSNEDCVLTLTNTNNNDLQCLTTPGNNDMFEGKRCEAFSTEAPVSNTGISTTNPSQSLTTEPSTVAPTADPSQSPLTTAPTADPSQSPLTTVVATPEQTETFQTSKQAISTVIATLESTVYSIKETTTEHVTDNTDDDSNTEDESVQNAEDKIARHDNTLIMSLVVGSIAFGVLSLFFAGLIWFQTQRQQKKQWQQDEVQMNTDTLRTTKGGGVMMCNTNASAHGGEDSEVLAVCDPVVTARNDMDDMMNQWDGDECDNDELVTAGNDVDDMINQWDGDECDNELVTAGNDVDDMINQWDNPVVTAGNDVDDMINEFDEDECDNNDNDWNVETGCIPGSPRAEHCADTEPAPGNHVLGESKNEIAGWLDQMGLMIYFDTFIQNGFTSLEFIKHIGGKSDLYDIGIVLKAHQMMLMAEIIKLRSMTEGGQRMSVAKGHRTSFIVMADDDADDQDEGAGGTTYNYNTPQ